MALSPNSSLSNLRIPTHRSSFDMSFKKLFTAKVGEILPVGWQYLMPGEKIQLSLDAFSRTVPVNTAAYTRIKEYYDVFNVPLRLFHSTLNDSFTQMDGQSTVAISNSKNLGPLSTVPHVNVSSLGTYIVSRNGEVDPVVGNWAYGACKLLDYLRYGPFLTPSIWTSGGSDLMEQYTGFRYPSNSECPFLIKNDMDVNLLPLAAYQKIYYDYFSDSQWETPKAYAYNFSYIVDDSNFTAVLNDELFRLHYCNYPKDMFLGVVPNSQYGDVAVLPAIDSSDVPTSVLLSDRGDMSSDPVGRITNDQTQQELLASNVSASRRYAFLNSDLSVLSIRAAEYLQRWKEIVQFGNKDYCEQIYRQFGIRPPQYMGNMCYYVGGHSSIINIGEVVNTNLTEDASQANIAGKGIGSSSSRQINFTNGAEPSIMMVVYHAMPLIDYEVSAAHPQLAVTEISDFPQPAFDQLGLSPVPQTAFDNATTGHSSANGYLGYNLRYWQFKSDVDTVTGAFRTNLAYQSWAAPIIPGDLARTSGDFDFSSFKVYPEQLNPIFEAQISSTNFNLGTDQILCNCQVKCYSVKNLDRDGLPF